MGEEGRSPFENASRVELRKANATRANAISDLNLDGSIKKNTSFIRKLKTSLTAENLQSLQKEMMTLKLEKYLSELVVALAEVRFAKNTDIWAAVEICSVLHQRFPEFSQLLIPTIAKGFTAPQPSTNPGTEQAEKEENQRTSKQKVTLRFLAELYVVGVIPPEKYSAVYDVCSIMNIKKAEESNNEILFSKGDLSEERRDKLQKATKIFEKIQSNLKTLSQTMPLDMPELVVEAPVDKANVSLGSKGLDKAEISEIWEDDESRQFYEQLVDLREFVPNVLIGDRQAPPQIDVSFEEGKGDNIPDEESVLETPAAEEVEPAEKETSQAMSSRAALDAVITRLFASQNRTTVDELAVEIGFLNSKSARKRIITAISGVFRERSEVIPYTARLIATLAPYMPEIPTAIIENKRMHAVFKRKDKIHPDERLKIVKLLGELTKFRIAPIHLPLYFIKSLIDDFSHVCVELLCTVLETCGRFLSRSPESRERMQSLLEVMMRKKSVQNLDTRLSLLIENAFFVCNPPEVKPRQEKERSIIELYLRKLLYRDLNRKNVEKIVLKQLRKCNWDDPDTIKIICKIFRKIWKIKFANIHLMAFLVGELSRIYSWFGIVIVDSCLEEIRWGLETNIFKYNHRRISSARYLAELYNYRMVDNSHFPEPFNFPPVDFADDFFRVRICCAILESCGPYFDKGSLGRRLDEFLAFFEVYITSKSTIPREISFLLTETVEVLRPKYKFVENYEDAVKKFNEVISENSKLVGLVEEEPSDDEEDYGGLKDSEAFDTIGDHDSEASEPSSSYSEDEEPEEDVEETIVLKQKKVEVEVDEEFEKEFNKTLVESLESRKNERKAATFDVAIPAKGKATQMDEESLGGEEVIFRVLTKKGNKQQVKHMALPSSSSFAQNTRIKKEAELEEKQQLKRLVLSYEAREGESERQDQHPKIYRRF
ncbi:hypothetical protein HDU97_005098 [Phlyctochytrium planicorne]|nr:hypothetical protein HDU97_005098 [Phlyctochytrium planicorne]